MFSNEVSKIAPVVPEVIGVEAIRAALKTMPHAPGIYRMMGVDARILYIGKAKNLFNRVGSYAQLRDLSTRILRMISQVVAVEFVVTHSEAEALLLEANLVRKHRPHYNILLKDDKSFPYLRVDRGHPYPRIEKHRGSQSKPGEYFGPFASVGALNETMALLQRIFLLRPCSDSYFKNRTRPCLQYQIKRCSAPCVGLIGEAEYTEKIAQAQGFLKGHHRDIQEALAIEMDFASAEMEYEKAALLRDRIRALTQVQQEQGMRVAGLDDADVIALARRGGKSVVQVSFYRQGGHFGQQSFHPRHEAEAADGDILAAFIAQFYQAHTAPPEILVNLAPTESALLAEALRINVTYGIDIRVPLRGDKLTLVNQAQASAEAALARTEMEQAAVRENLERLKEIFGLARLPQRIEVYDNSHTMGKDAVGAFIVATPEGFDKRSYRTFTIRDASTVPGDDYAMMREVFRRRFKNASLLLEGGIAAYAATPLTPSASGLPEATRNEGALVEEEKSSLPDLVLIDGGLGQLHAVQEALVGKDMRGVCFVGIAKGEDRNAGREWFFMEGRAPFQLPHNDPALYYLQRLRDEAHRFAIGRHRNKRSAALTASALDDIPGIGSGRKRALLQHFGSRADVERATITELEKVSGISKGIARSIYDFFHG